MKKKNIDINRKSLADLAMNHPKAFEAIVIGWLEGSLDVPAMQASIAATIQSEITPVNEDLYFTWMNPAPAPTPGVEEEE